MGYRPGIGIGTIYGSPERNASKPHLSLTKNFRREYHIRICQLKGSVLLSVWPQMAMCAGIAVLATILRASIGEDDYIIKENTNENDWDSLLKTEPILSISEKLQRTSIKKGPTHKKTKVDEESLIESDFLNSFMEKVKPSAISGFVAEESKNKQERRERSTTKQTKSMQQ